VKSLTAFPQVLGMMNGKLDMTQKLGDAFLAQQKEVLAAVQVLRSKAQAAGNLKSGKEQTVSTAQEAGTTVIKIEPANPQTVYVPTYSPNVYGPWPYPSYPPYYHYPPAYVPGAALFTFGVGLAVGAALWGNCNWGGGNVNVNVNKYNNFNKTNIQNSNWQHNAEHRKGAQYRDSGSQQKFGGGQRQHGGAHWPAASPGRTDRQFGQRRGLFPQPDGVALAGSVDQRVVLPDRTFGRWHHVYTGGHRGRQHQHVRRSQSGLGDVPLLPRPGGQRAGDVRGVGHLRGRDPSPVATGPSR
jgi:hypothetical protein